MNNSTPPFVDDNELIHSTILRRREVQTEVTETVQCENDCTFIVAIQKFKEQKIYTFEQHFARRQ